MTPNNKPMTSEAREWWVYQNESCGEQYVVDKNQRGFDPEKTYVAYPVIEISRVTELEKQVAELKRKINTALDYCDGRTDQMWAASVVSSLLDCDFRDSKSELAKHREMG